MKASSFLPSLVLLVSVAGFSALIAQDSGTKTPQPAAEPDDTSAAKTEAKSEDPADEKTDPAAPAKNRAARLAPMSGLDALFRLVQIGRTHEGVRYPMMEGEVITAIVDSQKMTRLDENTLRFEKAVIDQKGADPVIFRLERAVYDRTTEDLVSDQPTTVENPNYKIEGDSMIYNRASGVSRMQGRVRMTIYDAGSMQTSEKSEAEAAATEKKEPTSAPISEPSPADPASQKEK